MKTIDNIRWQLEQAERSRAVGIVGGILFSLAVWIAAVVIVLAVL